jgi:hypothetical protein
MPGRDYKFLSRFVHKVALQYAAVAEMSFDVENALTRKEQDLPGNHIFISGLARSGTTILLKYLYETGAFKALTYSDMPFVLMPNTWKKISYRSASPPSHERAHNDGIMIGPDSPEAFEEVFWRVFCGKNYIRDDRLMVHKVDADLSKKFKNYIGNVLGPGVQEDKRRYLSKNNNNILRIDYLQKTFPEARIIVPFRDPLQQSISLLNQHLRFSDIHKTDRFSLNYMNWLGHFEFGLNQKPFFLGDEETLETMQYYPKTELNFWLLSWKNYYGYLSRNISNNTILFNYEKFCADPEASLVALFSKIDIMNPVFELKPFKPVIKSAAGFDQDILEECRLIYQTLERKADQPFGI